MMSGLERFREVVVCSAMAELRAGDAPVPVCMAAEELRSGSRSLVWLAGDARSKVPPFLSGDGVLLVAYGAQIPIACFMAMDWALPAGILDLQAEFRVVTNGYRLPSGDGLLGALSFSGLDIFPLASSESAANCLAAGAPYSVKSRMKIMNACAAELDGLRSLLDALPGCCDGRALLRGAYAKPSAAACIKGLPVRVDEYRSIRRNWPQLESRLIARVDSGYGVHRGRLFDASLFARYLDAHGIAWPSAPYGGPALDADSFSDMAKAHPALQQLHQLRKTRSAMASCELSIGRDGRNRVASAPFGTLTGRDNPKASCSLLAGPRWMRGFMAPEGGQALAVLDWRQQDFGTAAALSGDEAMRCAYRSGDPYIGLAAACGAAPEWASKETHPHIRESYKAVSLAVMYGMSTHSLALRLGVSGAEAAALLRRHRRAFPTFWAWSEAIVDYAVLRGSISSALGWRLNFDGATKAGTLSNFPMQANGAEMLRLASVLAYDAGVKLCATQHDSFIIESAAGEIAAAVETMHVCMRKASALVLGGFELMADAKIVRWPGRMLDAKGLPMWRTVMALASGQPQNCGDSLRKAAAPV